MRPIPACFALLLAASAASCTEDYGVFGTTPAPSGGVAGSGGVTASGSAGAATTGSGGSANLGGGGAGAASGAGGVAGAPVGGGGGAGGAAGAGGSAGGGGVPACAGGEKLCDGSCVAIDDPSFGCAPAGCAACAFAHATAVCSAGACALFACEPGYSNCNGFAGDGCETPLDTISDCGACGQVCSLPGATGSCTAGACAIGKCDAGLADCNGAAADGCETSLKTLTDCGDCGVACDFPNAAESCVSGACALGACALAFGDCDGIADNGCETPLDTTSDCGACDKACSFPNAAASCTAGQCQLGACAPGFGDCDAITTNGCETPLDTTSDCGACDNACDNPNGNAACVAGACSASCAAGFADCDGLASNGCESSLGALASCGGCGQVCDYQNADESCVGGACVFDACSAGFADCDGDLADGCETQLGTTSACGVCGGACSNAHGATACVLGACVPSCAAGYADCDGNAANGCEASLKTLSDCGACGVACEFDNAAETCSSGLCVLVSCAAGFANCDGGVQNGCETDLHTLENCGACGAACDFANGSESCSSGTCVFGACDAGFASCDGNAENGCEAALTTTTNCTACGIACWNPNGTTSCTNGSCIPVCTAGFASCDSNDQNGCETNLGTSAANCGACGVACSNAHGTTACVAGVCVPTCAAGYASCDGDPKNGCETSTTTVADCGGCGRACSAANVASLACTGGLCTPSCDLGWDSCGAPAAPAADDGCETNVSQSDASCGSCGNSCSLQGNPLVCDGGSRPKNRCGCSSDAQCKDYSEGGGVATCNTSTGLCSCADSSPSLCAPGEACIDNDPSGLNVDAVCSCNGGARCASGQVCCEGTGCKSLLTDPQNCAACGRSCPAGFACAASGCVCDAATDCNAGTAGSYACTVATGLCTCGATVCAAGERCQPSGNCG